MAFKAKTAGVKPSTSTGQAKADAFMNLVVVASDGTEHRLRNGAALHVTNLLERSVINKHLAAAENGEEITFTLKGTVNMVIDADTAEDIEL